MVCCVVELNGPGILYLRKLKYTIKNYSLLNHSTMRNVPHNRSSDDILKASKSCIVVTWKGLSMSLKCLSSRKLTARAIGPNEPPRPGILRLMT